MASNLALTGTYQNIEQAIVEAIHLLAPLSEENDGSARCKDIFKLVREATICIDGQPQTGNHRFTLFSSALSGRISSLKLFQKITDPNRHGSWWRLKVPYDEAQRIVHAIRLRSPMKSPDNGEWQNAFDFVNASRKEDMRNRFLSFVPLTKTSAELERINAKMEKKLDESTQLLNDKKADLSEEDSNNLDQLISLQQQIAELRRQRRRQDRDLLDGHSLLL